MEMGILVGVLVSMAFTNFVLFSIDENLEKVVELLKDKKKS